MPRREKGMFFELHPSPKKCENGKPMLYARPSAPCKRTMNDVKNFCSMHGMNSGMIEMAF